MSAILNRYRLTEMPNNVVHRASWLVRIQKWIAKLFGKSTAHTVTAITRTFQSEFVFLILLGADYEDELTYRIRTWKAILRTQELQFDILLTCDRIKRSRRAASLGEIRSFAVSHRFGVFRLSKIPVSGKLKTDCLMMAELDCVRGQSVRSMDGFAPQISDSLAVQLTKRDVTDLKLLLLIENSQGVPTSIMRGIVRDRWRDCLIYYHSQYCPSP